MMKKLSSVICSLRVLIILLSSCGFVNESYGQVKCGFDEIVNYNIQNIPNFINNQIGLNTAINNYISTHTNSNGTVTESTNPIAYPSTYIIPVVVHIVRVNDLLDPVISYAQVESQIDALNYAFSGAGVSVNNTNIQFCLVRTLGTSPPVGWTGWSGGAAEPGVMRYVDPLGDNQKTPANTNQLITLTNTNTYYPMDKMLNIWVVQTIDGPTSGLLGYSPIFGGGFTLDGIVIRADVFGSNVNPAGGNFSLVPQSAYSPWLNSSMLTLNQGKVLVHEVGHYLNLYHPFQNNLTNPLLTCVGCGINTDGDFCLDTEPCIEPATTYNCIGTIPNSCICNPLLDDPVENYMFYSTHLCQTKFTQGQSNRMATFLINFRSTLYSIANQQYCGIIGISSCIPVQVFADFVSTGNYCVNQPVSFSPAVPPPNNTALPTDWNWTFPGGIPNSSTSLTPNVTWVNPGVYNVTCTASDGVNTVTSTQIVSITACAINPNFIHNSQWHFGRYVGLSFTTGGASCKYQS